MGRERKHPKDTPDGRFPHRRQGLPKPGQKSSLEAGDLNLCVLAV